MARRSQQRQFVEALARLGGSAGNSSLREKLGWDERLYAQVRAALIEEGRIAPGRGRGGSVRFAQREEPTAAAPTSAAAPPRPAAAPEHRDRKSPQAEKKQSNGANLGFEATLWLAADKLRGNMEPSEYKHVVLGLIFLKYISDAFEAKQTALRSDPLGVAEDAEEYLADNVFWVPKEARWSHLQANARQSTIGKVIDDALLAIEGHNSSLKGVLPKDYARPALNKIMLGELIDLISGIGMGEAADRSKDILGRVYEYFLGSFAKAEGKRGGEFYTPRSAVRVLVEMLEPYSSAKKGGARLRPVLRIGRDVRAVRALRRGAWRAHRRHCDLRTGEQLHHLAAVQDEPRGARH